jgi:hypothetical protein
MSRDGPIVHRQAAIGIAKAGIGFGRIWIVAQRLGEIHQRQLELAEPAIHAAALQMHHRAILVIAAVRIDPARCRRHHRLLWRADIGDREDANLPIVLGPRGRKRRGRLAALLDGTYDLL